MLGSSTTLFAQGNDSNACKPGAAAPCYSDDAACTFCYGPENGAGNAAVRPRTCNGDFVIDIAGFYWNAHQDGMEYAIENHVINPADAGVPDQTTIQALNNLINATFDTPDFQWDFGFKAGIGYNSACDGWDLGLIWTWYRGKANSQIETEADDNRTILPLWSAFSPAQGYVLYVTDAEAHWKLQLNLLDLELGREFWNSKYVALRPFIGLRIACLKQDYNLEYKGGSFSSRMVTPTQTAYNDFVDMSNHFKGVGIRAGLDSTWNFGCGWGLYGNVAASIVYGRFSLDQNEYIREATSANSKTPILASDYSFRASRTMLDVGLGLQWSTLFGACTYGLTAQLGWETHLFFDQNQLWRVNRIGDTSVGSTIPTLPNNSGENVFVHNRGDLDTQGWTLRLTFEF